MDKHARFLNYYNKSSHKLEDVLNVKKLTEIKPVPPISKVDNENKVLNAHKKVMFFGSFTSPCQSAGACRTMYFCKMFRDMGYVSILSSFMKDSSVGSLYEIDKDIYLLPYANTPKNLKEKAHLYFNPSKNIKKVLKKFENNNPEIIVVYSVLPVTSVKLLKRYCKKHNIKIVFDVVESQIISQQSISSFFTYYLQQRLINNVLINKKCRVIAISSYLNDYYNLKKINSLLIPFVSDTKETLDFTTINQNLKKRKDATYILYAGNPSNKRDLLAPIFEAISKLDDEEKKKVVFIIAGADVNQLIKTEGVSEKLLMDTINNIVVLGKVDHYLIETLYSACDFTILVKPLDKKFSKAGFPTKVSESFAHGVPVISNTSSDLKLYLNNENSIIIDGDT